MAELVKPSYWKIWGAWICGIVGFLTIIGAILHGPRSYEIRILTGDRWDNLMPPIYLVERRWWNLIAGDYPLRFTENEGWEYRRDGNWMALDSEIEKQVDLEYWSDDDSDREW